MVIEKYIDTSGVKMEEKISSKEWMRAYKQYKDGLIELKHLEPKEVSKEAEEPQLPKVIIKGAENLKLIEHKQIRRRLTIITAGVVIIVIMEFLRLLIIKTIL
jgi:hypothetical protein